MLSSPISYTNNHRAAQNSIDLLESQTRAFDDIFKRPPSSLPSKKKSRFPVKKRSSSMLEGASEDKDSTKNVSS